MNILVGLGNPGRDYARSRHNAGFMFMDYWSEQNKFPAFIAEKKVFSGISKKDGTLLVKPQTFMNDSGKAVRSVLKWYGDQGDEQTEEKKFSHLFVVYDDLDLELGKYKIQFGSGPKIHNGLNSIREQIQTNEFWHVRIGVDSRNGDRTLPGHIYVLQRFNDEERTVLTDTFALIHKDIGSKC